MFTEGSKIETFFYEIMPYVYLTIGGSVLIKGMLMFFSSPWLSGLLVVCGLMLVSASAIIIRLRLVYRSTLNYHMNFANFRMDQRKGQDRRNAEGRHRVIKQKTHNRRKGERRQNYEEWFEKNRRMEDDADH